MHLRRVAATCRDTLAVMASTGEYLGLGLLALLGGAAVAHFARPSAVGGAGGIFTFHLSTGAFDEAASVPSVAVVVPPGFTPSSDMNVAVYFRGFGNCVENVIRDADGRCSVGGAVHHASHLAAQFVASGVNGILVLPELQRETDSGAAGRFNRAGAFETFLSDVLAALGAAVPAIGTRTLADVGRVSLMCHSGGYTATAAVLRGASTAFASKIDEVALLDALYGDTATFDAWIGSNPNALRPALDRRLVCVYTEGGGTAANASALASWAVSRLGRSVACVDASTAPVAPSALAQCGVLVKRSPLDHTAVSREWPRMVWATGPLRG